MNLTAAIRTAQNALQTTSAQTAITSRNVAGANDPSYSRKIALVSTSLDGGAQVLSVTRAQDQALYDNMIDATSRAAASQALADGLAALENTVGDPQSDQSPSALLSALDDSIQLYAASPGDQSLASSVVSKANNLALALNDATSTVQDAREQADKDMASAVDSLNGLLSQFESANKAVVNGTREGKDVTDALDQRDKLLSQISELVGVQMATRGDNDAVLYTDSGVTLFETSARTVSFTPSTALDATQTGNAVYVDGVPVTGDTASMPIRSGKLQGLAEFRDNVAVTYQNQLDEVARGLITAFAESDQSATPTLPDVPGLFTYSGAPAMPGASLTPGLAGEIAVNRNVDPSQGGVPARLRDGGIGDPGNPAYLYNTTGAAGFTDRLSDYLTKLAGPMAFDPAAELGTAASLSQYATNSVSWLELARQSATDDASYQSALLSRASDALSNATGVNLDDEMSLMLQLERTYQASSKLLGTVDDMLQTFMAEIH